MQQQRRGLSGTSSGSCQTPCSTPSIQMGLRPSEGPDDMDEDCRGICWSINSLAVPYEKKTSIVSTGNFAVILRARTVSAMSREPPEAHLCCIALLNLTFAAEAVESPIATSSPLRCSRDSESVPDACVERMTMTNASFRPSMVHTVGPGRGFRWAAGFTRNVTSVDDAGLKRGKRRRVIWRQAGQHPRNRHRCLQKTRRRTFASGSYTTSLGSSRPPTPHEGQRSPERGIVSSCGGS